MGAENKSEKGQSCCPYCAEEIIGASFPYCQACSITIFYCPKCREPFPRENKICPHCGAEIRAEVI